MEVEDSLVELGDWMSWMERRDRSGKPLVRRRWLISSMMPWVSSLTTMQSTFGFVIVGP